jgi:hypothetical protein
MLRFLEAFERRSWRGVSEVPFLLPFGDAELRETSAREADVRQR